MAEGVTTIDYQAFYQTSLTIITIPASVGSIADQAFADCSNLATVEFKGDDVTIEKDTAFPAGGSTQAGEDRDLKDAYEDDDADTVNGGLGTYVRERIFDGNDFLYWSGWAKQP